MFCRPGENVLGAPRKALELAIRKKGMPDVCLDER